MPFVIPQSQVDALTEFGSSATLDTGVYSSNIVPSKTNLGFGLTAESKSRLLESVTIGLERLVSRIRPGTAPIQPYERSLYERQQLGLPTTFNPVPLLLIGGVVLAAW